MSNPWSLERLQALLGQEESYSLEFKSSRPLLGEQGNDFISKLTKHVSAFLNSEGGVLVIGIEEGRKRPGKADIAEALSLGVPRSRLSASRLTSMLCDQIHPSVASYVKVWPVKISTAPDEELFAFVVEVGQGVTAYQAADRLYYSRRSYSSEAMEDKDIRLRMLAHDRPRAGLRLSVSSSPQRISWGELERIQAERKARSCNPVLVQALKKNSDEMTPEDMIAIAAAIDAAPTPFVSDVALRLVVEVENVGHVTIRRGAFTYKIDVREPREIELVGPTEDDTPLPFDAADVIPLYPGRTAQLKNLGFRCDLGRHSGLGPIEFTATVFLDGGSPVHFEQDVSQLLSLELEKYRHELEEKFPEFASLSGLTAEIAPPP